MNRTVSSFISAGRISMLAVAALAIGACGSTAPKRVSAVFFPPSPELPRVQFLTSFTGSKDVEEQSGFDRFVVGEKQELKVDKPYGVAMFDGRIYVCDTNSTVVVFDLKSKVFDRLKGAVGPGALMQPVNIFIEPDGTKYVTDPARGQIVVFDRNDAYVRAYGFQGQWRPVDAVTFEDRLYVADFSNAVVRVFDKSTGDVVRTIGDKGETAERLARPTNIAFSADGDLYVTDFARFQVAKFDRDGHFKSAIGKLGDNLGHFSRPKGIAVDRENRLFAVDSSFNNVQIFNKDGRLLMFFGGAGEKPGDLLLPAKVALDYSNIKYFEKYIDPNFQVSALLLVTGQFGSRRVNVYAYGQEKGRRYPTEAEVLKQLEERKKKEMEKAAPAPEKSPATPATTEGPAAVEPAKPPSP
jgi:hypothetical protein